MPATAEITEPEPFVLRREETIEEMARLVVVAWVVVERVMLLKMLAPVKVLLLESKVEEAAVIVMSSVPLKEAPLIFLAVSRAVAVSALPVTEPVRLPKIPPLAVKTPVIVEEALMVEEAVERKPWRKPKVVEVERP